jgi:hypothetical protein
MRNMTRLTRYAVAVLMAGLMLAMAVPLQAQECVGVMCAFSNTGPGRPPALEDTIPPDGFVMIFGEEPPPFGVGGQRVKLSDMAKAVQWRQNRQQFKGLLDIEVDAERVAIVLLEAQGVPFAWESVSGGRYIAVVGGGASFTHMPLATFLSLPVPDVGQTVGHMMIMRGACLDPVPERFNPVYKARNVENCKQ